MPAGGAAATGQHGEDIIDLGVCMKLLKKSIVFIPLAIMLIIFVIRVTLTHHKGEDGGDGGHGGGGGDADAGVSGGHGEAHVLQVTKSEKCASPNVAKLVVTGF